MILKSLTLKNFKSIGEEPQTINFAPITLLFGPNSAGKSTILKSLLYFNHILKGGSCNPSKIDSIPNKDIGGFKSLIHGHDLDREMLIAVEFYNNEPDAEFADLYIGDWYSEDNVFPYIYNNGGVSFTVELSIKWSYMLNDAVVTQCCVFIGDKLICHASRTLDSSSPTMVFFYKDFFLKVDEFSAPEDSDLDVEFLQVDRLKTSIEMYEEVVSDIESDEISLDSDKGLLGVYFSGKSIIPTLHKIASFNYSSTAQEPRYYALMDNKFSGIISEAYVMPISALSDYLSKTLHIGPLRLIPPRNFQPEIPVRQERWVTGLAAWDILHSCTDAVFDTINDWFSDEKLINSGYQLKREKILEISRSSPLMMAIANQMDLIGDPIWVSQQIGKCSERTRVFLEDKYSGTDLLPEDLGVGISQVIPVIVASVIAENFVLSIEQPELHIHPAFQVVLGDLFARSLQIDDSNFKEEMIDHCNDASFYTDFQKELVKRIDINHIRSEIYKTSIPDYETKLPLLRTQVNAVFKRPCFIIETHSEHLMLRLLKRIRQTTDDEIGPDTPRLYPHDVAVVYVEPQENGAQMRNIRINDDGEFVDSWPRGFFAERRQELM